MNTNWRIETPDFRAAPWELCQDSRGKTVYSSYCEELINGRWEPFLMIRAKKEATL